MKNQLISKTSQNRQTTVERVPSTLEWVELLKDIPVEKVEIDETGHYDPKKSPEFHDWMVNG